MTVYNPITDGQVDPDSPITSTLMTNLRNNPIAITEGSAGAPKVQRDGIAVDVAQNLVSARCTYSNDITPIVTAAFNVSGVLKLDNGEYEIVFATPLATSEYLVSLQIQDNGSEYRHARIASRTTTSIVIQTANSDDVQQNVDFVDIIIIGGA